MAAPPRDAGEVEPEPLFCETFSDVADMFEVGRKLGSGNFAKVIQATCKRQIAELKPGSQVAIKIVKKPTNMSPAAAEMLRSEIAILRSVRHPNIVRLYEVLETPGKLYLVMQLCTGARAAAGCPNVALVASRFWQHWAVRTRGVVLDERFSARTPAARCLARPSYFLAQSRSPHSARAPVPCRFGPPALCLLCLLSALAGGELFDRIVNMGRYSEEDARYFAFKLLNAVLYLHDQVSPRTWLRCALPRTRPRCAVSLALSGFAGTAPLAVSARGVCSRRLIPPPPFWPPPWPRSTSATAT